MQCPARIADIVCEILRLGLLRIRADNDLVRCQSQADHLHNLPGLLADFKPELLAYYWEVERTCFMHRSTPEEYVLFEPLWNKLADYVHSREIDADALTLARR